MKIIKHRILETLKMRKGINERQILSYNGIYAFGSNVSRRLREMAVDGYVVGLYLKHDNFKSWYITKKGVMFLKKIDNQK